VAIQLGYDDSLEQLAKQCIELELNTSIILIDGRACCGKSTYAKQLQNLLFQLGESSPRVIHMDDLYPGWDGLAQGADYLERYILTPLLNTGKASWQEYDWDLGKRNSWREFSGGTPLIIEGCGAINQYTAAVAQLSIWLEVPEQIRRERWLQRDGSKFDEFYQKWASQELDFIATHHSKDLAKYFYDYEAKLEDQQPS
jgi:uridine kinase